MGLLVLNYTTAEGFEVPQLYVQVESIRMLKVLNGSTYGCMFTSSAWKSPEDKAAGTRPIPLSPSLSTAEISLSADDLYDQTILGFAYDAIKQNWLNAGYVVQDYYPSPPTPKTYIYDATGYTYRGCNSSGLDKDGNPCPGTQ